MTDTEISALARKMMVAEMSKQPIGAWKRKLYSAISKQIRLEVQARKERVQVARRVA